MSPVPGTGKALSPCVLSEGKTHEGTHSRTLGLGVCRDLCGDPRNSWLLWIRARVALHLKARLQGGACRAPGPTCTRTGGSGNPETKHRYNRQKRKLGRPRACSPSRVSRARPACAFSLARPLSAHPPQVGKATLLSWRAAAGAERRPSPDSPTLVPCTRHTSASDRPPGPQFLQL